MNYDRDLAEDEMAELRLSQRLRNAAHRRLMRLPPGHPDEPEQPEDEDDQDGNE